MSEALKSIIALTLVSVGAGFVVFFFHSSFALSLDKNETSAQRSAVIQVFSAPVDINTVSGSKPLPSCYWIGKKDSAVIGYAFPIEVREYSGSVSSIVGIDTAGTILGIRIIAETRMPGLGMSLEDRISQKSLWNVIFRKKDTDQLWFTEQFKGMNLHKPFCIDAQGRGYDIPVFNKNEQGEKNVISAIAGATASTQAIVRALEKHAALFLTAVKESGR